MSVSNKFFCKKCKQSDGTEFSFEPACDGIMTLSGSECLKYETEKIADEINPIWEDFAESKGKKFVKKSDGLKDSDGNPLFNDIQPNQLKIDDGVLKYYGEESDVKTDAWIEIYKKEVGGEYDWYFKEGGNEKSFTKDYLIPKEGQTEFTESIIRENMEHIPQMIDDKLREFNFYTIDPKKGKQKISFTDDDRESMKNSFLDMSEKYPEDIAFIRSVVDCRGMDDKTSQPFVRIGSYRDNSNINLPFKNNSKGLGQLLDSGINYFTIENNPTADDRDFKILPGDRIKDIDFDEETKEMMSHPESQPQQPMKKEEPFEVVMKGKEKKGLESLINDGELTNNLTKKQKELLEKLKKGGYLFNRPVDDTDYDVKNVKSSEFTESFKVWKKKS